MKKTMMMLLLTVCTTGILIAQDNRENRNNDRNSRNVPPTVQQNFQRENPNAHATWQQSNGQWHARYKNDNSNNRYTDSYYDQSGQRIDSHTQWDRKNVPQDLDQRIRNRYHIREYKVNKIERPNDQPLYQVRVTSGKRARTVYTDEHGNEVQYRDRH